MEISKEQFGILAICSLRYSMGRQTYMPSLVRSIVKPHLESLSDRDISAMLKDCEDQARFDNYGNDAIDKPGWVEWYDLIRVEYDRREQNEASGHRTA